jgi:hypothetical protein
MSKDAIASHLSYFADGRRKAFAVRTTRLIGHSGACLGESAKQGEGPAAGVAGPLLKVEPRLGRLIDFR